MSEIKGLLVVCDRCGAQTFRKCTGEGEADGGYTRWNKFEPIAEGWEFLQVWKNKNHRLCPSCAKEWFKAMEAFNFKRGEKEKQEG